MLGVFHKAGFVEQARYDVGVVRVDLEIELTEETAQTIEARWREAAARSIERLLRPRSVAVIGASRAQGKIGHEVVRNLVAGGFAGAVHPVNPRATRIEGLEAFDGVLSVPGEVDLAVVAVPASQVRDVVDECATKGVRGLVVISAGFAETGPSGAAAQRELVTVARGAGMRLVGPNCLGIVNTAPDVSLNATFAPVSPRPGRVAFSSQSGGLGLAVLAEAERRGLGISSFVSVGNKADVSGNDLLRYWEQDAGTDVILLYLESFGNPRRFARVAREVSRSKPIVALKAGRTVAGTRAALSHTAALASPDLAVDALFAQTGVIRADSLEELFGIAEVLSTQPLPMGRRVAIVGNAGGPGILAADACEAQGLQVEELSHATQLELRSFLPPAAGVRNPVDMLASATASDYATAVSAVLADDSVDVLLVICTPPLSAVADDVARAIVASSEESAKPVVSNFLATSGTPVPLRAPGKSVPSFAYPEMAARALASICRYAEWRTRPTGSAAVLDDIRHKPAHAIVRSALAEKADGCWLDPARAGALVDAYGIRAAEVRQVRTSDEAADAACEIGFPLVLKAGNPDLVHKSDVGGVRMALSSTSEVRDAFDAMVASFGDRMGGAVLQPMVLQGVETVVGLVNDPSFGPLVMFGIGGANVELFGDRAFRVLPMTDVDARELVRSIRGSPLLFGYRGSPPVDVSSVTQLLLRVARLAEDIHEIVEMDLNPVIVSSNGAVAVDVKVRVAPVEPGPDPNLRRLM
jgi:acetyl coenzyme A synthetase (ADP forming)-like protein